jgi:hypothetical protein
MGFNPTDDGFTLAYSRRLLEGQVPHRDFISIRPVGSPLLHAPEVLLGGAYTFWFSRLIVWFQFAVVVWVWVVIASRLVGVSLHPIARLAVATIALPVSVHTHTILAWHTIDGLFLGSVGLVLATGESTRGKLAGYALIGAAALCKQNFVVLAPAAVLVLGDWRHIRFWIAAAAPVALYGAAITAMGALPDAWTQLTAETRLTDTGWDGYINQRSVLVGVLLGYGATHLLFSAQPVPRAVGLLASLVLSVYVARFIGHIRYTEAVFAAFGAGIGALMRTIALDAAPRGEIRAGFLALLFAWAGSISIGYNSPALGIGGVLITLLVIAYRRGAPWPLWRRAFPVLATVVALMAVAKFVDVRRQDVFLDRPANELTYEIGEVFPGTKMIRTNEQMYLLAEDLMDAVARTDGRPYTVIPDFVAYWAKAPETNPSPIDWQWPVELREPELVQRVVTDLDSQRGDVVIIVQKVNTRTIAQGFYPLPDTFVVVEHVQSHYTKIGETQFFELYQ